MVNSPKILHIESATKVCSVALSEGDKVLIFREQGGNYSHSELLVTFIDEILKEAGLKPSNLDAIAVSIGPGSYTGLRIGVSVAKGLSYSIDVPVISVPTLQAMAWGMANQLKSESGIDENLLFCPMIDARRMEVFTAMFDFDNDTLTDTTAEIVDEDYLSDLLFTEKVVFFGDGAEKCVNVIKCSNALLYKDFNPSARYMVEIALKKYNNKQFEDTAYFEPFYLKDFIAGAPKIKGLK